MNLTDKARRGSWEAMETLFDGTKTSVMHLCRVLLASQQAAQIAVPRIYRSLWEQVLSGRITDEEAFSQAAVNKAVTFCKTTVGKKDTKAFRIPANRNFVQGVGEGDRFVLRGDPWELVVANLPPLQRFLYTLPVLCGYTQAQLARLFHTNEETVRLALEAEPTNLKRICAAISQRTDQPVSLDAEEFHRVLESKRVEAEVPPSVDTTILTTIRALCVPIQAKLRRKRKRAAAVAGTVLALACLTTGIALAAVSGGEEETASESSAISADSTISEGSVTSTDSTASQESEASENAAGEELESQDSQAA